MRKWPKPCLNRETARTEIQRRVVRNFDILVCLVDQREPERAIHDAGNRRHVRRTERACRNLILAYSTGQKLHVMSDAIAEKTALEWEADRDQFHSHFAEMKAKGKQVPGAQMAPAAPVAAVAAKGAPAPAAKAAAPAAAKK